MPEQGFGPMEVTKGFMMSVHRSSIVLLTTLSILSATVAVAAEHNAKYERGGHTGPYLVTDFTEPGFGVSGSATFDKGKLQIDFSQGDAVSVQHSLSLLGRPSSLELTVRGGNEGNTVSMTIGSHFQTFTRTIGTLNGNETILQTPVPPEGWTYGGGENDGIARDPLRILRIEFGRGSAPAAPVEMQLVSLRCTTKTRRSRAIDIRVRLEEQPGPDVSTRTFQMTSVLRNLLDKPVAGTVTLAVLDWEEKRFTETQQPLTAMASGVPVSVEHTFEVPAGAPFVEARLTFEARGQHSTAGSATYTAPVEASGDAALHPASPWGMGVYLYRYPGSPEGLALMDKAAALAQAAGVRWSREEFSWAGIETSPGQYDFSFYDNVVDTANRHGISVYGLLAYWSRWTEPYTEKGIDDYCAFARAVVRHFKSRVKHWEIYNEPNIFFWSGPRELYPVMVKKAYAAIKEEDPEAQVLAISTAGVDIDFIKMCVEAGSPFDVLTVHPYRGKLIETDFVKDLNQASETADGKPVWITEMGWPTSVGGASEREAATLLARCYMSAVASGVCNNVSWYDFRNDGWDIYYNEENFGVLYNDLRPKPGYRALATVCRTFDRGPLRGSEDFGEGVFALQSDNATALWTADNEVIVRCRVISGTPGVKNLMGEWLDAVPEGGVLTLSLKAGLPVFITGARLERGIGALSAKE